MGQASSRTKHAQVVEEDPASLAETLPTGFFSTLQQRQGQEEQEQDQEQYEEYGGQDQGMGRDLAHQGGKSGVVDDANNNARRILRKFGFFEV